MTDGSWIDADGVTHPGSPPPGFVRGDDGRWSPPRITSPTPPPAVSPPTPPPSTPGSAPSIPSPQPPSAAPSAGAAPGVPTGPPPWTPTPTPAEPPRLDLAGQATAGAGDGGDGRPLLVLGAIVVGLLVALGGAVAYLVGRGGDDVAAGDTTTTVMEYDEDGHEGEPMPTTTVTESTDRGSELTTTLPETSSTFDFSSEDALGDVLGCARVDENTVNLEIENSTDRLSDYDLLVEFFDEDGTVIGTESGWVDHVRPGERVFENEFMIEERGELCRVVEAGRTDSWHDPTRLADVGPCVITGEDFAGDLTAEVEILHVGDEPLDFSIAVAFVNGQGIRVGEGATFVNAVRGREPAPGEIWSTTPADGDEDIRCEVVAVTASPTEDAFGFDPENLEVVSGCTVADDVATLQVTNATETTHDYWVSLVVYADGQRVSDTTAFVLSVPPGVSANERVPLFDEPGDACEAVSVDIHEATPGDPTDSIGTCEVTGADSFDDVEGTFTVTNNDGARGDFTLTLGFYDDDGVRQGTSFESVEAVDAGATVSDTYITFVDYDPGYSCRVDAIEPASP